MTSFYIGLYDQSIARGWKTSAAPMHVPVAEWTERSAKRGLDPLGMQTSSIRLYQSLVPGVSNVTLRLRYYALYPWLSHTYAKYVGHTDR